MVPVSGTVTFDGEPIATGSVMFVPHDRAAVPNVLSVTAGHFEGLVSAGEKRVEVRALRPGRGPAATGPGAEDAASLVNYIPAKYNDSSSLGRTVEPPGPHVIDLELSSAP
jgi:hypothetical protein